MYSLMDNETNLIIDVQIVDKREVEGKSPCREKLGLQRSLACMKEQGVNVVELITDASISISSMMRMCVLISSFLYSC